MFVAGDRARSLVDLFPPLVQGFQMKLHAVITREELLTFAAEWLPLKLLLGDSSNEERFLQLTEPSRIEVITGKGLRISCRAQIRWPVLGWSVPVTARQLSVLLEPAIEQREGQPALVFRVQLEQADLAAVPARLDAAIRDGVNRALAQRVKPAWNFGSMLTRSIAMPAVLATTASIELEVAYGNVAVTDVGFEFELAVKAHATRRNAPA
jgi:hypothetical protein